MSGVLLTLLGSSQERRVAFTSATLRRRRLDVGAEKLTKQGKHLLYDLWLHMAAVGQVATEG